MSVSKCHGVTKKGKPCEKKVIKGQFCHLHVEDIKEQMEKTTHSLNKECPICLDDNLDNMFIMDPCGHGMHKECAKGMQDTRCPFCRTEVVNWGEKECKIKKSKKTARLESIEEDRRLAMDIANEGGGIVYQHRRNGNRMVYRHIGNEIMLDLTFEERMIIDLSEQEINVRVNLNSEWNDIENVIQMSMFFY